MEDLTKTQLILLALMVSFITSIATGIVTVTLLDQAPPGVTQTINRVVERTVEKVVPGQAASVITKETTVIIKEENLIIDAVEKNSKNVVKVALADEKGAVSKILGVGVLISADGSVVTDSLNLVDAKEYLIRPSNGKLYPAALVSTDLASGISLLKIVKSEKEEEQIKFSKPSFGEPSNLRLGQTVVAIGGLSGDTVSTGIVSKFNKKVVEVPQEEGKGQAEKEVLTKKVETLVSIETSAPLSADYSGGPLIDVDGFLLAINIQRKDGSFSVPINIVLDMVSKKLENAGGIKGE